MVKDSDDHAIKNAQAWLQSIEEMTAKHKAVVDADDDDKRDEIETQILESPLSVQVRGGWHNIGETVEDEEFEILLSTGGPALRIIGELDRYNQPTKPLLQHQDWGTPWIDFHTTEEQEEALEYFCQQFYFGE